MIDAYACMHDLGHAHSVEIWLDDELVGGLYGVALGKVYFGESMFSKEHDASKVALVHLVAKLRHMGFALIDCQLPSTHLENLGSRMVPRGEFERMLAMHCQGPDDVTGWAHKRECPLVPEALDPDG